MPFANLARPRRLVPLLAAPVAVSLAFACSNATPGDDSGETVILPDGGVVHPGQTLVDGGKATTKDGGKVDPPSPTVDGGDVDPPPANVDSGPSQPAECLPAKTDNLAASINPPNGLDAANVPQFVMFGFDDNAYADGINWVVDTLFAGKKNADGTPAKATFFVIGGADTSANAGVFVDDGHQTEQQVKDAWKHAYASGHEVGNHTWDHAEGGDGRSLADWQTEVTKSSKSIMDATGEPSCALAGWRFPYLLFNENGFQAIQGASVRYDTSVEFGYDWWQPPGMSSGFGSGSPEYSKHFWWPFTLDQGLDPSFACCSRGVEKHPGLWEFPAHTFVYQDPADATHVKTTTGLDYNLWTAITNDAQVDFCKALKFTLDQRYSGNRAPFNLGVHSDIYSQYNSVDEAAFSVHWAERRKAIQCVLDYAISKPDVRVVSYSKVIEWLRNPKPLH